MVMQNRFSYHVIFNNAVMVLVMAIGGSLTACQQNTTQSKTESAAHTASAVSSSVNSSVNSSTNSSASATMATVPLIAKADEPLTKLLATTLNSGFLLAVKNHPTLNPSQKGCLANFDETKTIAIAQQLINQHLTATDVAEANDFYQQPVGQKLINFNNEQSKALHDVTGKTPNVQPNFTDDEKLQLSAFLQTNAGQKLQSLVSQNLQLAFAPIESAQLAKCQISLAVFNTQPASSVAATSSSTAQPIDHSAKQSEKPGG